MSNIRHHLLGLHDRDAEAAADLLDKRVQKLEAASGCGEDCVALANATHAYVTAVDQAGWKSPEERWEAWSQAVRAMEIFYFG